MVRTFVIIVSFIVTVSGATLLCQLPVHPAELSTAWKGDRMEVNLTDIIGRSDIILGRPNALAEQAIPLGNGRLGVSIWAENGLTAQLNRADTMPYRYATGQLVLPGLTVLTAAPDYSGRLDLFNGTFEESGAGISASGYVEPDSDNLVIDIRGVDATKPQTAVLKLWPPRAPQALVSATTGILAETWTDNVDPGASDRTFGSLSAITADGRNVSVALTNERTITLTVTPYPDGHLRIFVASPHYSGDKDTLVRRLVSNTLSGRHVSTLHKRWWNHFWRSAAFFKISSPDGSGEYFENLRNLYLFSAAAESGDDYPGSQAGVADLFSSVGDQHMWDPAAFWHWNLRMQVGANLGAGLPKLNLPYFHLYHDNLANIQAWTKSRMKGASGICIPETMRFNGNGIEYETWLSKGKQVSGWNCDLTSGPYYNARTLSTGAEVSLWIWQQYLQTGNLKFLREQYPVMAAAAEFLVDYEKPGSDGRLHTNPSNAHETQWDVVDPTTDLAARQALYTALIQAATLLHRCQACSEAKDRITAYTSSAEDAPCPFSRRRLSSTGIDRSAHGRGRPSQEGCDRQFEQAC